MIFRKKKKTTKKKRGGGVARTFASFQFPLRSLSSHYKKMCSSCIQQATVCIRRMYYLSFFFFFFISAVRVQACTQGEGSANAPPSLANYFKLMQFSSETELTPLILASKSEFSYDSHPLCKNPLFRTLFFERLCTDLGYILSKCILLYNSLVTKEKSVGVSAGILTTDTDTRMAS